MEINLHVAAEMLADAVEVGAFVVGSPEPEQHHIGCTHNGMSERVGMCIGDVRGGGGGGGTCVCRSRLDKLLLMYTYLRVGRQDGQESVGRQADGRASTP